MGRYLDSISGALIMYQLIASNLVKRISDNAYIPLPANESEGWAYEAWLLEGNKPIPADIPVIDMGAVIASRRYQAEVAGIVLNGISVDTDDRSKLLINGAALEAVIDPDYTMQWKSRDVFISLNGSQVIAIARAVRAHVQACFDRESELLEALSSDLLTDDMIEQGWP